LAGPEESGLIIAHYDAALWTGLGRSGSDSPIAVILSAVRTPGSETRRDRARIPVEQRGGSAIFNGKSGIRCCDGWRQPKKTAAANRSLAINA